MSTLSEQLRPKRIEDLVGQPRARFIMRNWLREPSACCWMFEGPPGVGKTTAALALIEELGCDRDLDVKIVGCADLTIEYLKRTWRGMAGLPLLGDWRLLILEEFEQLTGLVQMHLKVALDPANLPAHAVVVATTNDSKKIPTAVLQRFRRLYFEGDTDFAIAANEVLPSVWRERTDSPLPEDWMDWGYDGDSFSLRAAYDRLELELMAREEIEREGKERRAAV